LKFERKDRLCKLLRFLLGGGVVFLIYQSSCTNSKKEAQRLPLDTLGRYLFFDTRLSYNATKSCASCHAPEFAFTDGYRTSITAAGEMVLRNAPSLINSAEMKYLGWADPSVTTLEKQHERPLFGRHPVEMGVKVNEEEILARLKADTLYSELFKLCYPEVEQPVVMDNVIKSIAAYVRTLKSMNAPYDRYVAGDSTALSLSARKGMQLFFSNRLNCVSCHRPPYFTQADRLIRPDSVYANIGLYNAGSRNSYPVKDTGLAHSTHRQQDNGKFRIPTLRNLSFSAPYMHDGSVENLMEVIDIYASGGRLLPFGPEAGDGRKNLSKDKRITGFSISQEEKGQLLDFLLALSDSTVLVNPGFANPFKVQF
jgi:cytochrome c peroxidase